MTEENDGELDAILRTLTPEQLRFLQARMFTNKDTVAAKEAGIATQTVYNWENKADIDRAVLLSRLDGVSVAREKLRRLASKAVDALERGMTGKNSIEAAVHVLDRVGLVTVQKSESKNKSETVHRIILEYRDNSDPDAGSAQGAEADS